MLTSHGLVTPGGPPGASPEVASWAPAPVAPLPPLHLSHGVARQSSTVHHEDETVRPAIRVDVAQPGMARGREGEATNGFDG